MVHIPRRFVSLAAPAAAASLPGGPLSLTAQAPDDRATGLAALALLHLTASSADPLRFAALLGASPFPSRHPASGRTAELWETLATVAAHDLGVARTLEPHLDALAILYQAGLDADDAFRVTPAPAASRPAGTTPPADTPPADTAPAASRPAGASPPAATAPAGARPEGATPPADTPAADTAPLTWGVFAAEGGPAPLTATRDAGSWMLTGTKPWCSLADRLDAALVSAAPAPQPGSPAATPPQRQLFAVDLRHPGVTAEAGVWHARGLVEIPSGPVRFSAVPSAPVGAPGWYLTRPGFSWGGIAVAACWFGGAVGVARTLYLAATSSSAGPPLPAAAPIDPLLAMHLGAVDALLEDARRALAEAAAAIDRGAATGAAGRLLAKRTRATVARTVEQVLQHVGHALGPAPLALDESHAKRVADLTLYVRQHHAEKDDASLGAQLAASGAVPW